LNSSILIRYKINHASFYFFCICVEM
jgi:hypothetical protein